MPHSDDDPIHSQLSDEFPGVGIVATTSDGSTVTLRRYDVESQSDIRRAFEIIDGIDKIITSMTSELSSNPKAFDRAAKRHGFTDPLGGADAAGYIEAVVDEAKELTHARADVMYSFVTRHVQTHAEGRHDSGGGSESPTLTTDDDRVTAAEAADILDAVGEGAVTV